MVISFIFPHIANLTGWIAAEVGRQPWAVQGVLLTRDAISKVVTKGEVIFSTILFTLIYTVLLICFLYLLIKKIKHGPDEVVKA